MIRRWLQDMGSDNRFAVMVWAVVAVIGLGILTTAWIIWTLLELAGVL